MTKTIRLKYPDNKIFFTLKDGVKLITLSKGKFFWKDKEVKDVNKIYERFSEWMSATDLKGEQYDTSKN